MKKWIVWVLLLTLTVSGCFYCGRGDQPGGVRYGTAETALAAQKEQTERSGLTANGLLNMDELAGWASVSAEGVDGVTGGGDAEPVIVTDREAFAQAVSGSNPAVVIVSGRITAITDTGYAIDVGSNKTIVGADQNAVLKGGLNFKNQSNVIVSNLTIQGSYGESRTPDDCVNVDGSHHIWFHHLNIYEAADGNLDIKGGSNYITVSWCKFWYTITKNNHRLSCLIGSGAGDHDDTDYRRLKVTYHHNWFADNVDQRMPRVMYGTAHIYNNYYTAAGNSYCIGADCYASILVENNYFKDVKNPHQFMYEDNAFPVTITARGNEYDNTSGSRDNGQAPGKLGIVEAFDDPPYPYVLDDAKEVPELVQKYAGPQDPDPDATPVPVATPKPSREPTPAPTAHPYVTPSPKPAAGVNDNPPVYVEDAEKGKAIQLQGQNADRTNGWLELDNPFAGKDFSETPVYRGGYPVWEKGVTISYWEYIPKNVSQEGALLNFSGTHRAVHYQDWPLYIEGTEEGYQNRYDEKNNVFSLIREGDVTSGLQISTLGSFGFSEDDCTGRNENPYSGSYAMTMDFQQKNYFYYFARTSGNQTALSSEKGKWHFVTLVIQNDNVDTYVDGTLCPISAFSFWGSNVRAEDAGQGFNLGYGWKKIYRASKTSDYYSHGMTILDFLSKENTKLMIGGQSSLWISLGMNEYKTPAGVKLADLQFFDKPLSSKEVTALMNGETPEPAPVPQNTPEPGTSETPTATPTATPVPQNTPEPGTSETPTATPTATPVPSPAPSPGYDIGDADMDGKVTAEDALQVLRCVVKLDPVPTGLQRTLSDVDFDGNVTADDALRILQYVVKLIRQF